MSENIDEALAPSLRTLFASSGSRTIGKRQMSVFDDRAAFPAEAVAEAIRELQQPAVAQSLTVDQFVALVKLAAKQVKADPAADGIMLAPLRLLLKDRWASLGAAVLRYALRNEPYEQPVLNALPALQEAPEILDVLASTADRDLHGLEKHLNFAAMRPSLDQLRSALPGLSGEHGRGLRALLIESLAQRDGWTPWLTLFAILWHHPALGSDSAPHDYEDGLGAPVPASSIQRAEGALWSELRERADIRHLAGLVQDLDGPLSESPPDFREVYLERLRAAVGEDAELRQAAIEALLWKGEQRARPIAAFVATHLTVTEDIRFLHALAQGPDRRMQYAAATVLSTIEADQTTGSSAGRDTPPVASTPDRDAESPRTWLGDRAFEKAVEAVIAETESEIAREYTDHHAVGEEKLGMRFFTLLGERFRRLEETFQERAGALEDIPNASVEMRYRPVSKTEEGNPGIIPAGGRKPVKKLSADFCLVITAWLEDEILTRRGILVQEKRLYRKEVGDDASPWNASFRLDENQTRYLIQQTQSSFFMFYGPAELELGAGVIPARLVEDLALNQKRSAKALSTDRVRTAGETFAEWFTYQAMGLRTGDPHAALLEKAEKGPGSSPYPLVRYGWFDVDVRLGRPKRKEV